MSGPEWDDDRLTEAFSAAFGRAAPAGLVERTLAAASEPVVVPPRRGLPASRRWRVAGLVTAVAVAGAVFAVAALPNPSHGPAPTAGPGVSGDPSGLTTYDDGNLHFAYPSSWQIHTQLPATSGFGSTFAVLGTVPVDPDCAGDDLNCLSLQQMRSGTVSVVLGRVSMAPSTVFDLLRPGPDRLTTVAGLPAFTIEVGSDGGHANGADLTLGWEIATPTSPSNVTTIYASIKGPNIDQMRAQVEALIASFGYTTAPLGTIPPDSARDALTGSIAAKAFTWLDLTLQGQTNVPRYGTSIYGCIPISDWVGARPSVPGGPTSRTATTSITFGAEGWLGGPETVTCTGTIKAMAGSFWKVGLVVVSGSDSSQPDVTYSETDWLTPDGTVVERSSDGRLPASRVDLGPDRSLAMARAIGFALATEVKMSDFFACFSPMPGSTSRGVISQDPTGATHYTSVNATCTTTVKPRNDGRVWHLILDARWPKEAGHKAGEMISNVEVDAAGVPGEPGVSGDPLPDGPPLVTPSPQSSPGSP